MALPDPRKGSDELAAMLGRRNLLGGMVLGTAAASAAVVAGPAAAIEQATRERTHQNILDHLDDII